MMSLKRLPNKNPVFAFKFIWVFTIIFGELVVFDMSLWTCGWPDRSEWDTTLATPYRIILIGDPQIIDEYSYGRKGILQKISEIFPDMYMHKNWENIGITFSPDAIIFMGDLLDGGREWNDEKWNKEFHRFSILFRPMRNTQTYYLVGNHDIGFGSNVVPAAYSRFRTVLGQTNWVQKIGNHTLIAVDTVTLSGQSELLKKEATELIEKLGQDQNPENYPRILFTHVPLYRPPQTDCGPLRQKDRYISQGVGYQYQNLVSEPITNFILDNVRPKLVFSGDDHDYCEVRHGASDEITEISVNSFSFAMGVPKPGFEMLSLYNPLDSLNNSQTTGPTYSYAQCLLPNQLGIYFFYIYFAIFTFAYIFLHAYFRIRRRLKKSIYDPASSSLLPQSNPRKLMPRKTSPLFTKKYWKCVIRDCVIVILYGLVTYAGCLGIFILENFEFFTNYFQINGIRGR